jgi:TPR repeat protein
MEAARMGLRDIAENRAARRARIAEWMAAAVADDVAAQVRLAWEYARGDVIDQDVATAWRWFERAAASGEEEALVNRARFLQLRRVPEGIRELRQLAARGNWKAQFWLGHHYRQQNGRFNQLRAVVWFDRSRKSGNAVAKVAKLAQLKRVAPLRSKFIFAVKEIIEGAAMIWSMTRDEQKIALYESLIYGLRRRK